jgi:hypothetical protein
MRVIIIQDKDAKALLDSLKLEQITMPIPVRTNGGEKEAIADIHRRFHYRVTTWLQDQGCKLS